MKLLKLICATAFMSAASAAQAQVVVVVSPTAPLDRLTREQVTAIFMGRSQQFPGGARAAPVDQANEALREQFNAKVLGKNTAQVKSVWSRLIFSGSASPPKEMADSAAVKAYVLAHPGAIGYIDVSAVDPRVKVILSAD